MRWSRLCFWLSAHVFGGRMVFNHAAPPNWFAPHGCYWAAGFPEGARLLDVRDFITTREPGTYVQVPRQGWIEASSL